MKATLVRFAPDVYEELREEAERSGVSVAQYVREAVVARMAYSAGRRGDARYLTAARHAADARAEAERVRDESQAVRAEHVQTRAQYRKLRAEREQREREARRAAG